MFFSSILANACAVFISCLRLTECPTSNASSVTVCTTECDARHLVGLGLALSWARRRKTNENHLTLKRSSIQEHFVSHRLFGSRKSRSPICCGGDKSKRGTTSRATCQTICTYHGSR